MEIFSNRERPNYEQIVSYGPRWITEYREMDANYKYAGWTLDLMAYWLERIVSNEFPEYADEETIGMWERVLRLERAPAMSLEERRRIVEAYLAGPGKMSRSTIKALAVAYTGQECAVYWVGDRLRVQFDSGEGITISVGTLRKILRRRLPAHISYVVNERVIIPLDNREMEKFLLKMIAFRLQVPFFAIILPGGLEDYNLKTRLVLKGTEVSSEEGMDVPGLSLKTGCYVWEEMQAVRAWNHFGIDTLEDYGLENRLYCKKIRIFSGEGMEVPGISMKTGVTVQEEMRCIRPSHGFGIDTLKLVEPDTKLPKLKAALYFDGREERIDVTVSTVRRNSWRFDGEVIMDGSRLFNSLFEEEVL